MCSRALSDWEKTSNPATVAHPEVGGTAAALPDIGQSYTLRYSFWNNLHYQFRVLHELAGLAYYRVMGWI